MSGQAIIFLASALGGAVLGILFDALRAIRKLVRHKTAATAAEDALFWIVATLLMFWLLMQINDGAFRFYPLLGAVLGVVLYVMTLSKLVIKMLVAALCVIFLPVKKAKMGLKWGLKCVKIKVTILRRHMKRRRANAEADEKDGHAN